MNLTIRIKKFLQPKDLPTSAQPPAVFRLSNDILISIFLLNVEQQTKADDWASSNIPSGRRPSPQSTMRRTSQVCHHWRLVALGCPALWSNIELSSKYFRWDQELIQRAIMRNGFSRVSLTCCSKDAVVQLTPQLLSHTSSYYGVVSMELWPLLTRELASPTTQLEFLCLFPVTPLNSFESFDLTPSLRLGKPCLKRLSFDRYFPIDITHPNLSLLTALVIRDDGQVPRYKTSEIISALANMPSLQELSLSASFQNTIYSPDSVDLPFLARLKLDGCFFSISLILRNINFPLSCSLRILCKESETISPPTHDMISHIVSPVARNMAYNFSNNLRITLAGHMVSIEDLLPMSDTIIPRNVRNTQLQCTYSFSTMAERESIFIQMIAIFHVVFQTTTQLTLDSSIAMNYPTHLIPLLLRPFTELVTINLNGHNNLADLFSPIKGTRYNVGTDLLPALHNIKLVGLSAKPWSLDALIDFLAWRLERNKSLHTLDFYFNSADMRTREIDITKRQLLRLEQSVVDINAYHVKYFGNQYTRFIKAVILHPVIGNRCQLEQIRNSPNDGLPTEQAKDKKIFPGFGGRK